jgi:hypothetical protein
MICLLGFVFGLSLTAAAQVTLPYITDFDTTFGFTPGPLNGQKNWIVLSGSAAITTTPAPPLGTQSIVLSLGSPAAMVGLPFAAPSPAQPVMYADCLIKPAVGAYISSFIYLDTSVAAFVRNGTQGQVFTFDGTSWLPTPAVFALNSDNATSSNWMRLTFRLDFSAKTWDLYYNNAFVAHDVGFIDKTAATLPFFIAQGDPTLPGYLNYLAAGWVNPLFANTNNDGIPDTWKNNYNLSLTANIRSLTAANGQTVLYDYINNQNPTVYSALPVLTSQVSPSGVPGSQGLVSVLVTNASGTPLFDAPITLSVTTGASTISTTTTPGSLTSVNVFTDANGIASAYVTFSSFATDVLVATAQSGTQTTSISININPPPTNLTSLRLWLKADDGVTAPDGSHIITWADRSITYHNDATGVNQPTLVASQLNGRPVVHFDATQGQSFNLPNVMVSATDPTQEAPAGEIFAVVRSAGTGSLWRWGTSGGWYPYSDGTVWDDFGTTSWGSLGKPAQDLTKFHLYNISSSSSEWTQRFNGLVHYDRIGNTVGFQAGPTLGVSNTGHFTGDMAEVIVFDHILTPVQRDTVGAYLGNKYGLYVKPPIPANLSAVPLSPHQVSLQWSAPPRGDHVNYLVERSTNGAPFFQVASVADGLSYIDTGLTAATTYTYRVRAQGYAGTSDYSSSNPPVTATTLMSGGGPDMPLTLTDGLRLWLKADAGVSANQGIDSWVDQSGNGNNATQGTGVNQPTLVASQSNGRPVVHFDATQGQSFSLPNVMVSATDPTQEATAGEIFAVVRSAGTGSLWRWGTSGSWYPYSDGTVWDDFGTTSWGSLGKPAQDLTKFHLYNISSSSSVWKQRFNGLVNYDRIGNTVGFQAGPTLGVSNTGYLTGDIAEIIVYDHVLTSHEREVVGVYFTSKYGLVPPSLLAPPIQSSQTISSGQVTLSWGTQNPGLSYLIERSLEGAAFTEIAEVEDTNSSVSTLFFTDASIPTGDNVVAYRIRAVSGTSISAYSNIGYAFTSPNQIDPTDGLTYNTDALLGLNPLADNSGALPAYPTGYGPPPPPPPDPTDHTPPVVTLLTPSQATLN